MNWVILIEMIILTFLFMCVTSRYLLAIGMMNLIVSIGTKFLESKVIMIILAGIIVIQIIYLCCEMYSDRKWLKYKRQN